MGPHGDGRSLRFSLRCVPRLPPIATPAERKVVAGHRTCPPAGVGEFVAGPGHRVVCRNPVGQDLVNGHDVCLAILLPRFSPEVLAPSRWDQPVATVGIAHRRGGSLGCAKRKRHQRCCWNTVMCCYSSQGTWPSGADNATRVSSAGIQPAVGVGRQLHSVEQLFYVRVLWTSSFLALLLPVALRHVPNDSCYVYSPAT